MGHHAPLFGLYRLNKYRNRHIRLDIYRNNRTRKTAINPIAPTISTSSFGETIGVIVVVIVFMIFVCTIVQSCGGY